MPRGPQVKGGMWQVSDELAPVPPIAVRGAGPLWKCGASHLPGCDGWYSTHSAGGNTEAGKSVTCLSRGGGQGFRLPFPAVPAITHAPSWSGEETPGVQTPGPVTLAAFQTAAPAPGLPI